MKNTWGIVIAVAAFLIQFIIFGICFSFGIYVIELQNEFETRLSIISSIGSIHFGFLLCTGPFVSFLMRKISYRKVCLLGAIMSSVGLSVLPFTPNIPYLIVFFGALTGTGYSFLYIPSYTLSGLWFENNRGLVTGIVSSGSSLGGIVFPYLIEFLIGKFGWRGSFFILASLNLQTVVFSCLMRESPMQKAWVKSRTKYINNNLTNSTQTIYTIHDDDGKKLKNNGTIFENFATRQTAADQTRIVEQIKHTVKKSRTMKLLTNLPFVLLTINNFIWNIGSSVQLLLGPDYYTKVGVDLRQAASLLSIQQGTMVVGCVVGGILGNLRSFNRKGLFLFTNFLSGFCVLTYTFPVLHTMSGLAIINSVFGLGTGIGIGLIVILVSDFVGSQLIGDGMGYMMLASGIGNFIGPPLGGYLIEKTGSYDAAFYLGGTATLFSGVILLIIPIRDCFQNSKKYAISPVT
ncbi:monocarboxylate transporter 13-like [Saccostrea echinata]|uniref:monocarboxylate transporter 13-like n=1 Tax=Saccostrea echinata TaxID=191078 RepID=UPI002A7EFEAC|nr:monocarboxylate transporter 13-like [Saccostrea echinata]